MAEPLSPKPDRLPAPSWHAWALVLAVLVCFGRLAAGDFLFWDDRDIFSDPLVHSPDWRSVWHVWTHEMGKLYIPVTYMVWFALARLGRLDIPDDKGMLLNPWFFSGANVLVHLLSCLLVLSILRRLLGRATPALLGAMVFALHPVQVETVGWISGMKDLLCWFFSLAGLRTYIRWVDRRSGRMWTDRWWIGSGLLLVLAMLSKPTALVVPAVIVLADALMLRRRWRVAFASVWPTFVPASLTALITRLVQTAPQVEDVPLHLRPLIALDALFHYLTQIAWPAVLIFDYTRRPQYVLEQPWVAWTWLLPAVAGGAILLLGRRRPELLLAGGIFVLGVAPVLGLRKFLMQFFTTVADHYLYFSMLGVAIAVASVAKRIDRVWVRGVLVAAIVALGVRSLLQTRVWMDDTALFKHALAHNPRSFAAHNNFAAALMHDARYDRAEPHLRKAIELQPRWVIAHTNLFALLRDTNRLEEARQTLERVESITRESPFIEDQQLAVVLSHLATGWLSIGEPERARPFAAELLSLDPAHPTALLVLQILDASSPTPDETPREAPDLP